VEQIDALSWQRPIGMMPMSPALLLKEILPKTGLRGISAVALNGYLEIPTARRRRPSPCSGSKARTPWARVRLYVLDIGNGAVPLAIDRNVSEPAVAALDESTLRAIRTADPDEPAPA